MEFTLKHFVVLAIAVLFIAKKILADKPFVKKYNNFITLGIVISLATFIAIEFINENTYIFYGSIGLAILASFYVLKEEFNKNKS